ncbi:hypothetical protein HYPSUDRAFT_895501 [Hypholoma sublateritium FD-334 SS-4]|uniref:Uncharacterized protein n=1 Tax=Hypholoma sublateritium (strain FD-334 SS-4) TaxID=945553 RepID=A0A0D2NRK2_HYPSF|nr:hypothetical protein HYPSUDRAFT_895501 [Hypholoma sublateritium FD-334 SS-4]
MQAERKTHGARGTRRSANGSACVSSASPLDETWDAMRALGDKRPSAEFMHRYRDSAHPVHSASAPPGHPRLTIVEWPGVHPRRARAAVFQARVRRPTAYMRPANVRTTCTVVVVVGGGGGDGGGGSASAGRACFRDSRSAVYCQTPPCTSRRARRRRAGSPARVILG